MYVYSEPGEAERRANWLILKLTNISPIMPIRKLSQVPFPDVANIKPKTAAGTVEGAITEID
jgi:hypothetical protein